MKEPETKFCVKCSRHTWKYTTAIGDELESKHCKKHACRTLLSDKSSLCGNPAKSKDTNCRNHARCHRDGCGNRRENISNPESLCCRIHTCDYITSQEQADGSTGRCEKEVLGSSNRCEEHQQCKEPSCDHEVILGGACCTAHTCKVRGCFESPSDTGFCLIHLPCAFAGCYENFAIDPQQGGFWEPSRFCTDHRDSLCLMPNCTELVPKEKGLCELHLCREQGCREAQSSGEGYCSHHTCTSPGCDQPRRNVNGEHCYMHKCQRSGCENPKDKNNNRCKRHRCHQRDCNSESMDENVVCLCAHHYPLAIGEMGENLVADKGKKKEKRGEDTSGEAGMSTSTKENRAQDTDVMGGGAQFRDQGHSQGKEANTAEHDQAFDIDLDKASIDDLRLQVHGYGQRLKELEEELVRKVSGRTRNVGAGSVGDSAYGSSSGAGKQGVFNGLLQSIWGP